MASSGRRLQLGWKNGRGEGPDFDVRTVYDLLDVVRAKPGIFIGEPTITGLFYFVTGFEMALHAIGSPLEDADPAWTGFHDWVAARYGFRESTSGWKNMLLQSVGSEAGAFERFFVELDAYRSAGAVGH